MPKRSKNVLTIEPIDEQENSWRLYGWLGEKKIRKQGTDLTALRALKASLELEYEQELKKIQEKIHVYQTWLSVDQLRDAEAAYRIMPKDRTLLESVQASDTVLGTGEPILCLDAIAKYKANLEVRGLELTTIKHAIFVTTQLVQTCGTRLLSHILPKHTQHYCLELPASPYTRIARARVLYTFFRFCVREKWMRKIPIDFNLTELARKAAPVKEPAVLFPEQCQALLTSACEMGHPGEILFLILSLWGFMRKSEVLRVKPEQLIIKGSTLKVHLKGKKLGSKWRDTFIPATVAPLAIRCIQNGALDPELCDKTKPDYKQRSKSLRFSESRWQEARRRCGLFKTNDNKDTGWAPNILRHTGMSYLFQETKDIVLVTDRAGNSEDVAFLHYLRDVPEDAYVAFNAVTGKPDNIISIDEGHAQKVA